MITRDPFRFEDRLSTVAKVGAVVAACVFVLVLVAMHLFGTAS